jgi:hypothetical protein
VLYSDRGSQWVCNRCTVQLFEAAVEASVGSRGNSYVTARPETISWL